ncbi:hypothetical protein KIW84_053515 [Lathyrus oleraceus]|uniref:Retrovirus-related Pol polyprotein from transposon TNT 1-94-like beta-barrel domain-containing protein n=1 Tax=Pisum sativum TaxID=3888 RepID=A0A9D4WRP8_PEA|nr:hypothetical protein KIW84_053515 [Pisum sativum]
MAESSSANGKFMQPAIPRFDGYYEHWAKLMENFLRAKEYWTLIEKGIDTVPEGTQATEAQMKVIEEQRLKDMKIKNYLYQAIDREILETILNDDTSKQIWDSMKQKFKELDEKEEMLLMAYVDEIGAKREDIWFLDSGCSNHMCGNKALFYEFGSVSQQTVKLGNDTRMQVSGKGSIKMEVDNAKFTVGDVFCVPELKNNLLSIGQLQERGLSILIEARMCKKFHPQREKEKWDWDKSYKQQILDELEWGESEDKITVEEEIDGDLEAAHPNFNDNAAFFEDEIETSDATTHPSIFSTSSHSDTEVQNRRPPIWMNDYVSGEGYLVCGFGILDDLLNWGSSTISSFSSSTAISSAGSLSTGGSFSASPISSISSPSSILLLVSFYHPREASLHATQNQPYAKFAKRGIVFPSRGLTESRSVLAKRGSGMP